LNCIYLTEQQVPNYRVVRQGAGDYNMEQCKTGTVKSNSLTVGNYTEQFI